MFKDMKIEGKIKWGFAVVLALLAVVALVTIYSLWSVSSNFQKYAQSTQVVTSLLDFQANMLDTRVMVNRFKLSNTESNRNDVLNDIKITEDSLVAIEKTLNTDKDKERLKGVMEQWGQYKAAFDEYSKTMVDKKTLYDGTIVALGGKFTKVADQVLEDAKRSKSIEMYAVSSALLKHLVSMRLLVAKFIIEGKKEYIDSFQTELGLFGKSLEALADIKGYGTTARESDALRGEYLKAITDFVAMTDQGKAIDTEKLMKLGPAMAKAANDWADERVTEQTKLSTEITAAASRAQWIAIIFTILAFIIGVVLALRIASGIITPLNAINVLMKDIAQGEGDLTKRLKMDSKDELGDLADSFNLFVTKIQKSIKSVAENTNQLSRTAENLSAISTQLASGAEEMTGQSSTVAGATEEISANVSNVSKASIEMSESVNNIAAAVEEVSSNVTTVATAMEEMTSSLQEVSKNCVRASAIAGDASTNASSATEIMEHLNQAAKEIGKVVDVINDIADQTNLLALNATIEAASAGEAGKGFAVVANEVKELAKQTAQATEEITQQVENMQTKTTQSVQAITQIAGIIREINEITNTIASAVEEQTATTNEISRSVAGAAEGAGEVTKNVQGLSTNIEKEVVRAIQEAAAGVQDVSRNIQGVNQAANETAHGAAQTNQISNQVSDMARILKETVDQFTV